MNLLSYLLLFTIIARSCCLDSQLADDFLSKFSDNQLLNQTQNSISMNFINFNLLSKSKSNFHFR